MKAFLNGTHPTRRVLLALGVACLGAAFAAPWARAADACCAITAIDNGSGLVTAREVSIGRTFQFRLSDPQVLGSLRVGQGVYANYVRHQVSVDGRTACGTIVKLQPLAEVTKPRGPSAAAGALRGLANSAASSGGNPAAPANSNTSNAGTATTAKSQSPPETKKSGKDLGDIKSKLKKKFGIPKL